MDDLLKRLQERRKELVAEQRAMLERAESEKRELTTSENQHWDRMNEEVDAIDARRREILEAEKREREIENNRTVGAEASA
jgi:hypothetical protein